MWREIGGEAKERKRRLLLVGLRRDWVSLELQHEEKVLFHHAFVWAEIVVANHIHLLDVGFVPKSNELDVRGTILYCHHLDQYYQGRPKVEKMGI